MADSNQVSQEDLIYTNMIQIEAITRLLINKGILDKGELLAEVSTIHQEQSAKAKGTGIT